MEETDAQLLIKKRARRRLVGAVAFVSVVAVILPMVMDHQPRQVVQDVEIRIPGQDEKPFAPRFAAPPEVNDEKPVEKVPDAANAAARSPSVAAIALPADKAVNKVDDKPASKALEKAVAKAPEKLPEKTQEKTLERHQEKTQEKSLPTPVNVEKVAKPSSKDSEAQRAAAILAGQNEMPIARSGEYLVLIGAFSNQANVKILKDKLGQLGIKTFTEPLDTPQGKKTRVRAGPFVSQEAAEKALTRMQSIGVSGVVAAK